MSSAQYCVKQAQIKRHVALGKLFLKLQTHGLNLFNESTAGGSKKDRLPKYLEPSGTMGVTNKVKYLSNKTVSGGYNYVDHCHPTLKF